jgi:hypothetical protein
MTGKSPSAKDVAIGAVTGAFPLLGIAMAKDEGDTAIPIMLYFGGAALAKAVAIYVAPLAATSAALGYGLPQGAGRVMGAHFTGAKGGYPNEVCYYPGLHKCPP